MQIPWIHRYLLSLRTGRPTVGHLIDLCEENYTCLGNLLPDIQNMSGHYRSCPTGQADLYLEVLEHTRYTSLIHLTYYFVQKNGQTEPDPDAILRLYHDARQLEVMELRQSNLPTENLYEAPGLLNKWQANLFVAKWLDFCTQQQHQFRPYAAEVYSAIPGVETPTENYEHSSQN
jgi:uncharacterized protein YqiB (DUF1249 family)